MVHAQSEAGEELAGITRSAVIACRHHPSEVGIILLVEHGHDLGEHLAERRIAVETLHEPLLDVAIRDNRNELAVGGGDDFAAVLLDRLDEVLIEHIIVPNVEVAEYRHLRTPGANRRNRLKQGDGPFNRLFPVAIVQKRVIEDG